jgi:hypothetical protein
LVENPIDEGGSWIRGGAEGFDWTNPKTTGGRAVASVAMPPASRYVDDIAHVSTSRQAFASDQFAEGTVYLAPGYTGNGGGHEVELLLRFSITPHNARGYEVMWGLAGYIAIVRWNGAPGDFTVLFDSGPGAVPVPVDGDVLRAEIVGTHLKVYRNGSLIATISDSTWPSGQPGIGFWPVDGAIPENYGWKQFKAGQL